MTIALGNNFLRNDHGGLRLRRMRIIMFLCLFDLVAPALVLLQVFNLSLYFLIPLIQPIIFLLVLLTAKNMSRKAFIPIGIMFVLVFAALIKAFLLTDVVDYSFSFRAVIAHFYSIVMPCLIFWVIMSQEERDPYVVHNDLVWFSKWFLFLSVPLALFYFGMHIVGRFSYFGFGINFHYAAPYVFHKNFYIFGLMVTILLTGKRSVLLNFFVQLGLYFSGSLRNRPVYTFVFLVFAIIASIIFYDDLEFLLRRFGLMAEILVSSDFSSGLFGIADTYESIVLFGGRLEEVTGVMRYFAEHPGQLWFGAPPGANYLWSIEWSDSFIYKSFAHLSLVAYVFRYGLIPTLCLLVFFLTLLFRGSNTRNSLWLVYVGTLSSATFGANLLGSPTAWVLIALYFRYGRKMMVG